MQLHFENVYGIGFRWELNQGAREGGRLDRGDGRREASVWNMEAVSGKREVVDGRRKSVGVRIDSRLVNMYYFIHN